MIEDFHDAFDLYADVSLYDFANRHCEPFPLFPEQLHGEVIAAIGLVHEMKLSAAFLTGKRQRGPALARPGARVRPHQNAPVDAERRWSTR